VASDFGFNRARGEGGRKKQERKNKNFSSPVACPGEEEGEIVPSKNDYVLCGCVCVFFLENA